MARMTHDTCSTGIFFFKGLLVITYNRVKVYSPMLDKLVYIGISNPNTSGRALLGGDWDRYQTARALHLAIVSRSAIYYIPIYTLLGRVGLLLFGGQTKKKQTNKHASRFFPILQLFLFLFFFVTTLSSSAILP